MRDKDGKLLSTGKATFNGDKIATSEIYYPDGKLKSSSVYDENGKIKTQKELYENGNVKSETEYYANGVIQKQKIYNEDGSLKSQITDEIDGQVGSSAQKSQGDCYLMASINALRQTTEGQQMLNNLITITTDADGNKIYKVTFPGAKKAAEALKTDPKITNGVAITGEYTFTEAEMQELLKEAGRGYSIGDGDAILLEAAFEKYRKEVKQTLEMNNLPNQVYIAGLTTGSNDDNILRSGFSFDALFVLTGNQSSIYITKPEFYLDSEDLREGKFTIIDKNAPPQQGMVQMKAMTTITEKTSDQEKLDKMLDELMNDLKDGIIDYMGTAGFATMKNDGTPGGHAFTIKSVTADEVIMINPWHPDEEVKMSREDFLRVVKDFALTPLHTGATPPSGGTGGATPPGGTGGATPPGGTGGATPPGGTGGATPPGGTGGTTTPQQKGEYTIPKGITYTNMIIEMLKEQDISPTRENIRKAKEQFEALNPGAVKTSPRFKTRRGQLIPYVLAGATVKTPKFEGLK